MGMSPQQIIQNDPEYLRQQLAQQEIAKFSTPGSAAGAIGAFLGRGVSNVASGRGFFSVADPALQRVATLQGIYNNVIQEVGADNPGEAFKRLAKEFANAGFGNEAAAAAQEAFKFAQQEEDRSLRRRAIEVQEGQLEDKRFRDNPELLLQEAEKLPDGDPRKQAILTRYSRITEERNYDIAKRDLDLQKVTADTDYSKSRATAARREAAGEGAIATPGPVGKSGAYRTATGRVASPTEMKAISTEHRILEKTIETFNRLTTDDVKKAESLFNFVDGVVPKEIAGKVASQTLSAQSRVAASQLLQQIDSLPPGAASDADMKAAKASFPGFGDARALARWINDTKDLVESYYGRISEEYGLPRRVKSTAPLELNARGATKGSARPAKVTVERLD